MTRTVDDIMRELTHGVDRSDAPARVWRQETGTLDVLSPEDALGEIQRIFHGLRWDRVGVGGDGPPSWWGWSIDRRLRIRITHATEWHGLVIWKSGREQRRWTYSSSRLGCLHNVLVVMVAYEDDADEIAAAWRGES